MIRPIDIRLNAAHPELPLLEAVTFTGSPSTVLIRGVPPNCGRWAITAVFVAASFPDGSTTTRAAVQSANGVWVATLPATATSGRTANGVRVMADGIDENGEAVTGYILGVADFAVASLEVTPAPEPGETSYQMLYFDEVPSTLRKGDVTKIDGVLKFYNGTAWEPFAAPVTLDNAVTRTSANGVKSSGIWSAIWGALSALPTGFTSLYDWCVDQLAGKMPSTATGADIPVDATHGARKINIALAGKQSVLTQNQLANIAAVSDALAFDATHSYAAGDPVVYNGTLYTFTSAHTGAWTGSDVSAVDIIARLAGKLDKSGGTMTGDLRIFTGSGTALMSVGADAASALTINQRGFYHGGSGGFTYLNALPNVSGTLALAAPNPTAGNLAALDANGNPTDSLIPAANVALKGNIPYDLGTPTVIDTASSETVEGETVNYGVATLVNRTANIVQVTAATALDELRITFPAATSGKVRDFGLRVEIGTGSAALAAPALVPVAPTGETIKIENVDGTIPELADGTATAKGVTLLYFSETASGVFVVKGEQVEEVA